MPCQPTSQMPFVGCCPGVTLPGGRAPFPACKRISVVIYHRPDLGDTDELMLTHGKTILDTLEFDLIDWNDLLITDYVYTEDRHPGGSGVNTAITVGFPFVAGERVVAAKSVSGLPFSGTTKLQKLVYDRPDNTDLCVRFYKIQGQPGVDVTESLEVRSVPIIVEPSRPVPADQNWVSGVSVYHLASQTPCGNPAP